MSKAYDRIEWSYLERVIRTLGFSNKWIKLIMVCVKLVSYSVVVNGKQSGNIIPSRGLRQGDPLSYFLFLLCIEGLLCQLRKTVGENALQGVVVARYSSKVSHLFFVDDSLLFYRTKAETIIK